MGSLIASDSGNSDFKRVPAGVFAARCWSMVDLGTQRVEFQGDVKHQRKVQIGWELFGEDENGDPLVTDDGLPMVISKRYTLSLSPKSKLRPDLEAWRGRPFTDDEAKGFDLHNLIGAPCMINVTHTERNGKTYSNVASLTPLPKALRETLPAEGNPPRFFVVSDGENAVFKGFHEKLQETIRACEEWQGMKARDTSNMPPGFDDADDIAF